MQLLHPDHVLRLHDDRRFDLREQYARPRPELRPWRRRQRLKP